MKLRLAIPSTLVMTLVCSCHGDGQHPSDAPARGDARVTDAAGPDAPPVDAARLDAPADSPMLADADTQPDAAAQPDAAMLADATFQPDVAVPPDAAAMIDAPIDAIPDADLA